MTMEIFYFLVAFTAFFGAFFGCLLAIPIIRRWGPLVGLLSGSSPSRFSSQPTSLGGGIAIFFGLAVACLAAWLVTCSGLYKMPLENFAQDLAVIALGALIIFSIGLIDDFHNLSPRIKLLSQTALVVLLFCFGIRITLFIDNLVFSFALTWAWLVLITNAFNLLDNMDGLSAGVAFISGAIFFAVAVQTGQWGIAFMLAGFLGSTLGFLYYNFPPASIFMGDCGSLLIGYLMAVLTIHATFFHPPSSVFPVALPLLVMAVPLFDTGTVVWIRLREKRPIFTGDTRHFSHRLVNLGLTPRQAVLTIYLITFATGISATLLYQTNIAGGVIIIVQIIAILAVIRILERAGSHGKK